MKLLETIHSPQDLSTLTEAQLGQLSQEIRDFLVANVARTGGHLGPNLGVVELTLGIHRVFDSPADPIIFDTGHQSYVHKLLTGRQDFSTLRQEGGLAGYPDRAESEHDIVESSHASSSLSWADGISKAQHLAGREDSTVVVLVGDGALTGGMSWEALNNIAADNTRRIVIVVNDNGRSYAPTIGALAAHMAGLRSALDTVRTDRRYERVMSWLKDKLQRGGPVSQFAYKSLHATKKGVKDWWTPQGMFEDLGLKYIGPIDGHDLTEVEQALSSAKDFGGPVLVHAITEKGHGYAPAINDEADQFHAVGVIDPDSGLPVDTGTPAQSWTSVFADEIVSIADQREDIVGITGAMLIPVGLKKFKDKYPERVFDVGIAEQHAVASAAGMAFGGLHPVVAIYATFLNRAFDQLLMDVALHKAGVTIVLDRAGVTGPDGPSHHGMWDLAMVQMIPGICVSAPRDAAGLRELLRESVEIADAPSVVRFAKGSVGSEITAQERTSDGVDILVRTAKAERGLRDVLIVSVGTMAELALDVSARLQDQGISATVVDPRWVLPVAESLIELADQHRLVVVIEDGVRAGGVGSRIRQELRHAGIDTGLNEVGLPVDFLAHGTRDQVLARVGLSAQQITHDVVAQVLGTKVPHARPSSAPQSRSDLNFGL